MQLTNGCRVRCVWLGVQLEDGPRHTTLASSVASTADNSLALVRKNLTKFNYVELIQFTKSHFWSSVYQNE